MLETSTCRTHGAWALVIGALLAYAPHQLGADPADGAETRLGAEIEALAERLGIPGLAWGVVQDGELLFDGAAGYSETPDQPFTVRTPLDIASISKSIAAVAVMQAVERGELELSDPVVQYLPDFSGPPEVTVRHLLSHTSESVPGEEYKYIRPAMPSWDRFWKRSPDNSIRPSSASGFWIPPGWKSTIPQTSRPAGEWSRQRKICSTSRSRWIVSY